MIVGDGSGGRDVDRGAPGAARAGPEGAGGGVRGGGDRGGAGGGRPGAGGETGAWRERAAPRRSGRATPVRRGVGAIAWHLRVGGPWRALPAGWPPGRAGSGWVRRR